MITQSGTVASLAELELEARAMQEMHEALYAGEATWRDWRPELTCPDRQDAATDESFQEMQEARAAYERALRAGAR